jgi:hypothetical protein
MAEMFGHPTWRKNAIIGLLLGVSGMIGLWGIGFFSPELISEALKGEKQEVIDQVRGRGTILFDIGAFLGMSAFTFVAALVSRRMAFLVFLILSMAATIFVFNNLNSASDAYWMLPMMGFAQLSLFAGYSIYFPSSSLPDCGEPESVSATTRYGILPPPPQFFWPICPPPSASAKEPV